MLVVCLRVVCVTCSGSSGEFNNSFTAARRFVRANHVAMLADIRRLQRYRQAIDCLAKNAKSALEIGCGPLCVLSINAARAGRALFARSSFVLSPLLSVLYLAVISAALFFVLMHYYPCHLE